jgi:uncharacterized protein (TIGR03437 family)
MRAWLSFIPLILLSAESTAPSRAPASIADPSPSGGDRSAIRLLQQTTAVRVSEDTCDLPDTTRYLLQDDPQVYIWFRVVDAAQGDEPSVEWLRPDGTVLTRQQWPKLTKAGNFCFHSGLFIANHEPARRPGEWRARVSWNGTHLFEQPFTVLDWTPAPAIPSGGVVNGADFTADLAPGIIFTIFGADLAPATLSASGAPLPEVIDRVSVEITDPTTTRNAPLFFVSRRQINAQVPFGIAPGRVQVRVRWANRTTQAQSVDVRARNPKLFTTTMTGRGAPILVHANYQLVSDENPAQPGEPVVLFLTGLGDVTPPLAAGQAAGDGTPGKPLNRVSEAVEITVGTQRANVLFAGLAPGFVGLYQVNFLVPDGLATTAQTIRVGCLGVQSQSDVRMAVRGTGPPPGGTPVAASVGPQGGRVEGDGFRVDIPAQTFPASTSVSVVRESAEGEALTDSLRISGLDSGWKRPIRVAVKSRQTIPADASLWCRFSIIAGSQEVDSFLARAQRDGDYLVAEMAPGEDGISAVLSPPRSRSRLAAAEAGGVTAGEAPYVTPIFLMDALYLTCPNQSASGNVTEWVMTDPDTWRPEPWQSDAAFLNKLCSIRSAVEGCVNSVNTAFRGGWPTSPPYEYQQTRWPILIEYSRKLDNSIYGHESPHNIVFSAKGSQYLILNFNKVAEEADTMKETACHELFHIVQNLYDPRGSRALRFGYDEPWIWFYEASATWFQQFAFSDRSSYVNPEGAQEGIAFFRNNRLNFREGSDRVAHQEHGYGASAFVQYLTQAIRTNVVGDIIAESRNYPDRPDRAIVKGAWGLLNQGDLLGTTWVNFLRAWMKSDLFPARAWPDISVIRTMAPGNETIRFKDAKPTPSTPVTKSVNWKADNYMARLWSVELPASWDARYQFRIALVKNSGGEALADIYAIGNTARRLGSVRAGEGFTVPDPATLIANKESLYVMAIHHANTIALDDDRQPVDLTINFELSVDFAKTREIVAALHAPLLCRRADNSISACVTGLFSIPVSNFGVSNWNAGPPFLEWQGNSFRIKRTLSNGTVEEAQGTVNAGAIPPTLTGTFSQASPNRYTYRFRVTNLPLSDSSTITFRTTGVDQFKKYVTEISVGIQDPVAQLFQSVDWDKAKDAYVTVGLR